MKLVLCAPAVIAMALAALTAQSAETNLRFEVASVKRSDPSRIGLEKPLTYTPGHYAGEGVSLATLAWNAWDIKEPYQFESAFPWMASERYDIAAKVPDGATIEQVHAMLQHLLAERFGLVVHHESRQMSGFRLVAAKEGTKLRKSAAPTEAAGSDIVTKNGIPKFSDGAKSGMLLTLTGETIRGRQENMSGLAHQLISALHVPVIDATGLAGEYDFDLSFAPEAAPLPKGSVIMLSPGTGPAEGPASPAPPSDHPTLFAAIKQQLGLQLEAIKSVPVEVLVLDKANREPAEN